MGLIFIITAKPVSWYLFYWPTGWKANST